MLLLFEIIGLFLGRVVDSLTLLNFVISEFAYVTIFTNYEMMQQSLVCGWKAIILSLNKIIIKMMGNAGRLLDENLFHFENKDNNYIPFQDQCLSVENLIQSKSSARSILGIIWFIGLGSRPKQCRRFYMQTNTGLAQFQTKF